MNPDHHSSLNPSSSLKSRFTKTFLRSLIKINKQRPFPYCPREIFQRCHRVKTAADKSLARAAGSRRVWSRAMLCKIRNRSLRRGCQQRPSVRRIIIGYQTTKKGYCLQKKMSDDQEVGTDQASKLRKLVPGGEAMDLCSLLDEAAHYIKCLNTQVQVMRRIADIHSS
ncbi:hypothetical protein P3X46_011953 [Hevea brasiliensis]|uniref:IBH1-like N-terminal domain-containing protein n=1 Tax=Hevea brasiliensis TaxID=3981 RepID=A0ABQ9MB28_HEVBR|nr:transcription factor IBH1 [Hevea brasiliensis]KAJ9176667.1 hypothetical protein P3X46_011953 [Hevea brasiliensis]